MSHVTRAAVPPGRPLIIDLTALLRACELHGRLELRVPPGCRLKRAVDARGRVASSVVDAADRPAPTMSFRTWYSDHGRYVGDYQEADVRSPHDGAVAVIGLNTAAAAVARFKHHQEPYELGVVPDPNNPGCYTLQHDFFNKGCGLEDEIGATKLGAPGKVEATAPKLLTYYQMAVWEFAAREQGHEISFGAMQADGTVEAVVTTPEKEVPAWA